MHSQNRFTHTISTLFLMAFSLVLISCTQAEAAELEIEEKWADSAHADTASKSFTLWDDKDPAEVPTNCAKCHSTSGYLDFLGADGSTHGQVDTPVPIGETVECDACHDPIAEKKEAVIMPSGLELDGMGQESNCIECHQGRASSVQVAEMVADQPQDTVNVDLQLPSVHNNAVGATVNGTDAQGGFEYPDQVYIGAFYHGFDTCITCHDPHALPVNVDKCSACHLGATTLDGVRDIRLSKIDYDGDGDIAEGLSGEIETMMEKLLQAIRFSAFTTEEAEGIEFNGRFQNNSDEAYATWTPRLLQAAYNYQYVAKDPGSYSHNPKYILQLLYDSLADLGGDTRGMTRPSP